MERDDCRLLVQLSKLKVTAPFKVNVYFEFHAPVVDTVTLLHVEKGRG